MTDKGSSAERVDGKAPEEPHDVYVDRAGWGGHRRYTCHSCVEHGISATLLRQPWMGDSDWSPLLAAFREAHPWQGEPKRYPGE